jgi:hypothetical protein
LYHNLNPSVQQPAICLLDGDSKQAEDSGKGILKLPGNNPESYIFDKVLQRLEGVAGELTVALLKPYEDHVKIEQVIRSVSNTNRDPHLLFAQVGKALGFIPEGRVKEAFLAIWARAYPEVVGEIVEPFKNKLPTDSDH